VQNKRVLIKVFRFELVKDETSKREEEKKNMD